MTLRIQIFQPINERTINAWLAENPRIEVKALSVSAGAIEPGEPFPLSVCAIIYESPTDDGTPPAALAAAEQLIAEVTASDPGPFPREGIIIPPASDAAGAGDN
jgi:hypothetical protein